MPVRQQLLWHEAVFTVNVAVDKAAVGTILATTGTRWYNYADQIIIVKTVRIEEPLQLATAALLLPSTNSNLFRRSGRRGFSNGRSLNVSCLGLAAGPELEMQASGSWQMSQQREVSIRGANGKRCYYNELQNNGFNGERQGKPNGEKSAAGGKVVELWSVMIIIISVGATAAR